MPKPCVTRHPLSQDYAHECHLCWLDVNDEKYRRLFAGYPQDPRSLECVHLGDILDKVGCHCTSKWIRECDLFGKCTLGDPSDSMPSCVSCPKYQSEPVIEKEPRRLILCNRLSPGDCLVMTTAIECLHNQYPKEYLTAVESPCPAIFENNPRIAPKEDGDWEKIEMTYSLIHRSDQEPRHFLEGYVTDLGKALGIPLSLKSGQGFKLANKPYLYLSEEEKGWVNQVQETTGKKTKFWLLNAGCKSDFTAKQYPYYQQVIDLLHGKVLFVQVGESKHIHPNLERTLNLVGKTDLRQLIRLSYHCEGVLSGTSFLMHLAAAWEKPAVIVAGGREPRNWNTYPRQTLLSTLGALPCCSKGACWKSRVVKLNDGEKHDASLCENPVIDSTPVGKCMTLISPEEVAKSILRYYEGGALSYV